MPLFKCLCVGIVIFATISFAKAANLRVYLLTGQSNSLGTTNLEPPFELGTHAADSQTHFFWSNVSTVSSDPSNVVLYGDSGGVFSPLTMQQGDGVSPSFWGPEFGLARTLFDSGQTNIAIIKLSRGGGGNGYWLPGTGHMYSHVLAEVDVALTALQNAGQSFDIEGFLYLQGESNNPTEAASADTRLQSLIDGVASHINANYADAASDMYTVIGEIAASQSISPRSTTTRVQRNLADAGEQVAFIYTRDLPLKTDSIHFGGDAKLAIGRRFADAFNSREWVENRNLIAGYSAYEGGINAIPHPSAQGFTQVSGDATGVEMEEVNDAGIPAWRISNDSATTNPSYRQSLTPADFQQMFANGWTFKATAKVVRGSGLALWSVAGPTNDPGWDTIGRAGNMNGFLLSRVNDDELEVQLWQNQPAINLGAGSADKYHTLELRGRAFSPLFDFYIDEQLQSMNHDLTSGPGFSGFENSLVFNSGATLGTGREVYWSEVSLSIIPEPTSVVLMMAALVCLAAHGRLHSTCRDRGHS